MRSSIRTVPGSISASEIRRGSRRRSRGRRARRSRPAVPVAAWSRTGRSSSTVADSPLKYASLDSAMNATGAEELREEILRKKAELRVGSTLREKWRLDALIGVGGMAAVYEATHRNGMRGAVKILHSE